MPRHLISDAHEWINEIPTVPIYYLAKPQPRERAWRNQRGKKTLGLRSTGSRAAASPAAHGVCRRLRARQPGTGEPKGGSRPHGDPVASPGDAPGRRNARKGVGRPGRPAGGRAGLRYVLIPGESRPPGGAPTAQRPGGPHEPPGRTGLGARPEAEGPTRGPAAGPDRAAAAAPGGARPRAWLSLTLV